MNYKGIMKRLFEVGIYAEVLKGYDLYSTCEEAIALANKRNLPVAFMFNETLLIAHADTKVDSLAREYNIKRQN